jgi:hypothetical protein
MNVVIDICYTACDPRVRARAGVDEEDKVSVKLRRPAPSRAQAHTAST